MSHYLVDRIERSPRIEVMTETEVSAVHGTRDRRDREPARPPRRQRPAGARRTAVFVMIGADPCTEAATGMLARRRRRLPALRRRRRELRGPPRAGRCPTASRTCSRPSAPACSRPATCAPERRSASRARSATARWSCASPTTCWPADSGTSPRPRWIAGRGTRVAGRGTRADFYRICSFGVTTGAAFSATGGCGGLRF